MLVYVANFWSEYLVLYDVFWLHKILEAFEKLQVVPV